MVPHALHSRQAGVTLAKQGTSLGLRCSTLPPRHGSGDVPRTFPVNAHLVLLLHITPSCKPLGLIAAAMLGEAVKAEPQGDNKASGEKISRDQIQRGSHPTPDSQRSLCSRCLLFQRCAAFKGCGEIVGLRAALPPQPLAVGQPPVWPGNKKGGLISVTGLIPA